MVSITGFKQFISENASKISAKTTDFAGKVYTHITQAKKTDLLGQISVLGSCALGLYLSAAGENAQESFEGLLAGGAAASLSCLGWSLLKGAQGEPESASKLMLVAGAIGGLTVAGSHLNLEGDNISSALITSFTRAAPHNTHISGPIIHIPLGQDALQPCTFSQAVEEKFLIRVEQAEAQSQTLIEMVEKTLSEGGKLVPAKDIGTGTSGVYFIKDHAGKTVALFKPADEGTWKPNNPNPQYRKEAQADRDDIYFHKMDSWEQGKASERQQLAYLLNFGNLKPPVGAIVEISSPLFFDRNVEKQGLVPVAKQGYLQEWIPNAKALIHYHPTSLANPNVIPPMEALNFHDNPMLSQIPLSEFQDQGIYDLILSNEDRNVGNLMIVHDESNLPHMRPIDNDAIYPWKLRRMLGIYTHENAKKTFTPQSLKLIESLDEEVIERLINHADLSEQAAINARATVVVLKKFADAGGTLRDVYDFVASPITAHHSQTSQLWHWIEKATENAKGKLEQADQDMIIHNHYLKRAIWCKKIEADWCKPLNPKDEKKGLKWLKKYARNDAPRIQAELQKHFWEELNTLIDNNVQRLSQQNNWNPCKIEGNATDVCWKVSKLAPGVTHHRFSGNYADKKQRFEMLKLSNNAKAKLRVQDARGVFKPGETPRFGRLQLTELAKRVPNAIAAVTGGFFHYNPPPGEYYEWNGTYKEGDLVGEAVVDGKLISENPKERLWGAVRIDHNDKMSFVDTNQVELDKNALPKYSLGSAPTLVANRKAVTMEELGPGLPLKPKQASAPGIQFRTHIGMEHARTAVCEREEDKLLVLVEGRQRDAVGLNMPEFANLLKDMGCKNALNLDGGGSADLVTKDEQGRFVTSITASDPKGKRPTASAIVITKE